jgi:hypothetical protein
MCLAQAFTDISKEEQHRPAGRATWPAKSKANGSSMVRRRGGAGNVQAIVWARTDANPLNRGCRDRGSHGRQMAYASGWKADFERKSYRDKM